MSQHQKAVSALTQEAQQAGLAIEHLEEIPLGRQGVGSALGHLFGSYAPTSAVVMRVCAPDGLRWVYVQPYSMSVALPGEHYFTLRGAPAAPLFAPGPNWFERNFRLRLMLALLLAMTILGIPLAIALLVVFPRPAKLEGGRDAVAINATSAFASRIFGSRFGMPGFVLPWVVQIHSLGDGQSCMACLAPKTASRSVFGAPVADFAWTSAAARRAQSVLAHSAFVAIPPQRPRHPLGYLDLVAAAGGADAAPAAPSSAAAGPFPIGAPAGAPISSIPMAAPPVESPGALRTWLPLTIGAALAGLGLIVVGMGVHDMISPVDAQRAEGAVGGTLCATTLCVLPGLLLVGYGAWHLWKIYGPEAPGS